MAAKREWHLLVPAPVRRLPADLAAVLALVGLTLLAVFLPGVRETPLRVVVGLPFVLFVPGYALIAALFPENGAEAVDDQDVEDEAPSLRERGIDGIERVALSFGLSIAVVPLIGLVLNFTPWGIRLLPIMVAVSGFTVVAVAVAAQRRWELPEDERFSVPYRAWVASARSELFEPETRADAALNVLLVLSIVLAASSVGYAVMVPKEGEQFTELYLLTENESGSLVADDYPSEFELGERKPVVIGVGNQEHEPMNYTVVVELQRVEFQSTGNNSTQVNVLEREELRRFSPQLAHNQTWHRQYSIEPTFTGKRLRLAFLLYKGNTPPNPGEGTPYRNSHLWVNVTNAQS